MAEWDAWIDAVQIKTDFFYASPRLTCDDVQFLRDGEQLRRSSCDVAANDLASVRRTEPTAEIRAWTLANTPEVPAIAELARQGIQTVALLYRLTAWFVPHTPDGDFLQRASRDLVQEFTELVDDSSLLDSALSGASARFGDAFAWFKQPYEVRQVPPPPTQAPDDKLKRAIQGGILEPYAQVTHGALLLLAFKQGADASAFWAAMQRRSVSAQQQSTDRRTVWNVALTPHGLRAAGLTESELSAFPLEFRQGMEDRNSVLGDLWINHPDRWRRPVHPRTGKPIEMSAVHVVVQLRCGQARGMPPAERIYDLNDATHPLHREMADWVQAIDGCMDTLAAQPMVRHQQDPDDPASPAMEHFGYVDGDSQPELDPAKLGKVYRENLAQPGGFIVGLANAADSAEGAAPISGWLRDGSFLGV